MDTLAAVAERVVARITAVSPRGSLTAIVRETRATISAGARQGVAGPPGRDGAASAVEVIRATPAATWTIPHTLGRRPLVTVYGADGAELLADVQAGPTTVTVTFAAATAGSAVLI